MPIILNQSVARPRNIGRADREVVNVSDSRRPAVQRDHSWFRAAGQVGLVIGITFVLWYARGFLKSPHREQWMEVTKWLEREHLTHHSRLFWETGLITLEQCAILDTDEHFGFSHLDQRSRISLQVAAANLKDSLILQSWLQEYDLEQFFTRLKLEGVRSLDDLAALAEPQLQRLAASDQSLRDYNRLRAHVAELRRSPAGYNHLKARQWRKLLERVSVHKWSLGGLFLFSLFIGSLVILVNMNYASVRAAAHLSSKHSILEFVTGKYLAIQLCKVHWEWDEPQVVGKTMTFRVKFYQRNGRPYVISNRDNVLIEVMHGSTKIPPTIQLGGTDPADVNTAKVVFTVHRAGEYKVSILVGAKHIKGSPFIKKFQSGQLDPAHSRFVGQTSVVVATAGESHPLQLEPRDEYSNLCSYTPEADHRDNYRVTLVESGTETQVVPDLRVTFEKATRRIVLHLRLDHEGCYTATATYRGVTIKNGNFTILVLNERDSARVKKSVAKKSTNIYYEARLLSYNYDKGQKAKKVFCYISPKQLTVKEFYLKVIPKRLFTFRVCPSTKFQFLGFNNQYESPVFIVEDGSQPPVELAAKDRNIIAATFTNFLLKNIGGSETFKDKQDFFYHEVRQVHSKRIHDKMVIKINRANLLESSLKATKNFSTSDWCKNFEIVFQGEEGLDWGGLRREWFEVLSTCLFYPTGTGLFRWFKEDNQSLVHPNPNRPAHLKTKLYEFAGKIVGKCLYESALGGSYRQLVKARFTRSFLAQLIGLRVNYKYFEQDDPELFVSKIQYIEQNDVEDMELTFTEEEYKDGKLDKVVELLPNGAKTPVTNRNKLRYLDALAQYRLASSVRDEIESFLKGLNELIPDNLLSIFDENELELLMCGTGNYSITDFKEHHIIAGSTPEFHKVLEWFWTIVSGFTREEMARLLQFTTGCSQLPPGGFAELNPKFQITAMPMFGTLPTAHTCFNQLSLPDYDSLDDLHQGLLIAITEGNQGFGMI